MDRTLLSETLRELFNEETGASLSKLDEDLHLTTDLGLDSVDQVALIMQVERQFRIRFANAELKSVTTIGELLDLVAAKLQQQSAQRAA